MLNREIWESLATRFGIFALGAAASVLLTRALGPQGRGLYASVIALMSLGLQFGSLGLGSSNTYFLSGGREDGRALAANAFLVSLVLGSALGVAGWFAAGAVRGLRPGLGAWPILLGLATIPVAILILLGQNLLIAKGDLRAYNGIELVRNLAWIAAVVAMARTVGIGARSAIILNLAAFSAVAAWIWIRLAGMGLPPSLRWRGGTFRRTVGYGLKAYAVTLFAFLVLRLDLLLVQDLRGAAAGGTYSVAVQMADLLLTVASTVAMVLAPRTARLGAEAWPMVRRVTSLTALALALAVLAAYALAPRIVGLLFGVRFEGAVPAFRALLPGIWFLSVETLLVQYLNGLGMRPAILWGWAAALVLNLALNLLWIPRHGILGAALASTLAYAFMAWFVAALVLADRRGRAGGPVIQALSLYPLTEGYRRRLEERLGAPVQARVAGDFRMPTLWATFRAFRSLGAAPLVLATEDPSAGALESLLLTMGALFGPGRPRLFDHRWQERRHSRLRAVTGLARVLLDSLRGRWHHRRLLRRLEAMRGHWRPLPWRGGDQVAYLKTNLWFGLKAGGSVGHVAGVVNGLVRSGRALRLFANEPQPLVEAAARFHGIRTPSLCAYPGDLNLATYHRAYLRQVRRQFAGQAPEWIYQRLSVANFVGAELSRELGLPLVVEYNGSEVWVARNWGRPLRCEAFAAGAEEAMLAQASLVVAVSEVLGDELRARGLPRERIFVHPNCVDPGMFRPDRLAPGAVGRRREALGIPADALVACFLGTFGPWHGVLFLAEALKALHAREGAWIGRHGVHFLLVGDGPQRAEAARILHGLPGITFTGLVPQSEAPDYLALSDLFLSPHVHVQEDLRFFGSPTKLFEYMAMGRAILASDLEQIGAILAPALRPGGEEPPGAAACLFRPGDQAEFLQGLRRLVEDPALRARLGSAARARALRDFTWDGYARRLGARLEALAAPPPL